jgi:hypothetical protein
VLLAIGTQFPDLIDKPLAWSIGVLPTGRTLGHSLLVAVPISIAASRLLPTGQGAAFTIGYGSHLAADALWPVVEGQVGFLAFLLWPVLPSPTYEVAPSFGAHLTAFTWTSQSATEIVVCILAGVHWLSVGRPGLAAVRAAIHDGVHRSNK